MSKLWITRKELPSFEMHLRPMKPGLTLQNQNIQGFQVIRLNELLISENKQQTQTAFLPYSFPKSSYAWSTGNCL